MQVLTKEQKKERTMQKKGAQDVAHQHLANNIPNNAITRWAVGWANRKMRESDSRYRLRIRYRKPRKGKYTWGGTVKRSNSRAFSLYLLLSGFAERERAAIYRAERAAERARLQGVSLLPLRLSPGSLETGLNQ